MPPKQVLGLFRDRLLLPADKLKAVGEGAYNLAWSVASVTELRVLERLQEAMLEIIGEGGTVSDWLDSLDQILDDTGWGTTRAHAETIYRTTLGSVYEADRFEYLMGSPFVEYLVFDAINDNRVRPEHLALDGKAWHKVEFPEEYWPPLEWNCFLPGTKVEGTFSAGYRMLYRGEVVSLQTARGARLTVTPNHPIATLRGFIAAGELAEGDEVLGYRSPIEVPALATESSEPPFRAVDHEHGPATIQEVFEALAEFGGVVMADVVGDDFHGDAKRGDGHIDVANPEGVLGRGIEAGRAGDLQHLGLKAADATNSRHVPFRHPLERLGSVLGTAPLRPRFGKRGSGADRESQSVLAREDSVSSGLPCGSALPLDGGAVPLEGFPLHLLRFGAAAGLDAALEELSTEGRPRDAGFFGELLERYPGMVARDQVVEVRKFDWSGHVYDLRARFGVIVAEGVLASNCRCSVFTATAEELREFGATPRIGLVEDSDGNPVRAAEGFRTAPSVHGLNQQQRQELQDKLSRLGWDVEPPTTPSLPPHLVDPLVDEVIRVTSTPQETGINESLIGETAQSGLRVFIKPNRFLDDSEVIRRSIPNTKQPAHEAAAGVFNDFLGGLVTMPRVVLREVEDVGESVVMEFIENAAAIGHSRAARDAIRRWEHGSQAVEQTRRLALFDALIGNTDRHPGNAMWSRRGMVAIDHGYAFGLYPDHVDSFALALLQRHGELGLTDSERRILSGLIDRSDGLREALGRLLSGERIDAILFRARVMLQHDQMPPQGAGL